MAAAPDPLIALFAVSLVALSPPAMASNLLALPTGMVGGSNDITQAVAPAESTNTLTLNITGDRNGGTGSFSARFGGLLQPGTLLQDGTGNALTLTIDGNDNLFAVEQIGTGNIASILVSGAANQMLVSQIGVGNTASVTQTGQGNMVAIRQRGR